MEIAHLYINCGKTAKQIAQLFRGRGVNLPLSTVYSILHRLRDTGEVRPSYTTEELNYVAQLQKEHNEWTYSQLRAAWREKFGSAKKLSNHIIWKALSISNITTKMLEEEPEARDDPETIATRKAYCQAIHWSRDSIIFIDEVGYTLWQRRRGRSVRGRPARVKLTNAKGPRINVCAAVSPRYGLVYYQCLLTSCNGERFRDFMHHLSGSPTPTPSLNTTRSTSSWTTSHSTRATSSGRC